VTTTLVTGATGNVGSRVVQRLRARGATARAFVRDPAKAAAVLPPDVEVAAGDLDDPASVRAALGGVDQVFLTTTTGPLQVAQETAVIDAAAELGVRRLVKLSTVGAQAGSPLPGMDWHGQVEDHLRASPVPSVVVRAAFFMSNLLAGADAVRQAGKLFAPAGGGKVAMIDPGDVAAAAAAVLTTPGHLGATYELTGPAPVTYDDVAAALSDVTGRRVDFVDVPPAAAREAFVAGGLPDFLVTHLDGAFGLIRSGALEQVTDTVRTLTGRDARSVADFLRDHAALFTG
jgi:uncharacterized protein YbjT (DUF2867 family)